MAPAKVYNNTIIREHQIEFPEPAPSKGKTITEEEYYFLQAIKRGEKVVLDRDDYRIASKITEKEYNLLKKVRDITEEECELLEKVRAGNIRYVEI